MCPAFAEVSMLEGLGRGRAPELFLPGLANSTPVGAVARKFHEARNGAQKGNRISWGKLKGKDLEKCQQAPSPA